VHKKQIARHQKARKPRFLTDHKTI